MLEFTRLLKKFDRLFGAYLALLLAIAWLSAPVYAQQSSGPFECEPVFYHVIGDNPNYPGPWLYKLKLETVDPNTGIYTGAYIPVGKSRDYYNAIGWDVRTNYIYGLGAIRSTSDEYPGEWHNHLLKIGSDGVAVDLGVPVDASDPTRTLRDLKPDTGPPIIAGDMDRDGNLWGRWNMNLIKIDVDDLTFEVVKFTPDGDFSFADASDIVYIDKTNAFWGAREGYLYKWDLTTHKVKRVAVSGLPVAPGIYGAAYTDKAGNLYVSRNSNGSGQGELYRIDDYTSDNPTAVLVAYTIETDQNDGASCPDARSPFYVDLELSKKVELADDRDPAGISAGDTVIFTITVENKGPSDATGVEVTDQLPSGYTYVSSNPSQGTYNSNTGVWNVDSLANSDSTTLTITATVNASGDYINVAEITDSDQADPDSTPNNDDPSEDDYAKAGYPKVGGNYITPFECRPGFYQVLWENLKLLDPATGDYTLIGTSNDEYNAIGWDVRTNLIYGVGPFTWTIWYGHLLVVGSDGVARDLGVPVASDSTYLNNLSPKPSFIAGDMDRDGHLYVRYGLTGDARLIKIDVDLMTFEILDFDDSNGSGDYVGDIVYVEGTDALWGVYHSTLYKWDLKTREITSTTVSNLPSSRFYGAAFTDNQGNLYVASNGGGVYIIKGYDTANPYAVKISDSAETKRNDGASCPIVSAPFKADLELSKAVSPTDAGPGDTVTFTITLTNNGPNAATGVEITDRLPSGYSYVAGSIGGDAGSTGATITSDDSNTPILKWTVNGLDNGKSVTLTFQARVNSTGDYNNTVEVTDADQVDPDSAPNNGDPTEDDYASASVPVADLELTKSVSPDTAGSGDTVTFTIVVQNKGPNDATGVEVTDPLPNGYTYVSSDSSQGSYDPNTGVWDVGGLANGDSATLTITAKVRANGDYLNAAEITDSDQADPDSTPGDGTGDDYAEASILYKAEEDTSDVSIADLELSKVANPTSAGPGERIVFTIQVINRGPNDATGVKVLDQLPDGYDYVSHTVQQGTYDPEQGIWNVGGLTKGAAATLEIVVSMKETGDHANIAEVVASDQKDPDSIPGNGDPNEDDYAEASVELFIPLLVEKDVDPDVVRVGDTVTYSVKIRNPNDLDATFELVDEYDTNLEFVEMLEGPDPLVDAAAHRLAWDALTIASNSELVLRYRMLVTPGAGDKLDNIATLRVSSATAGGAVYEAKARASVQVLDPIFVQRLGTLLGRVYFDLNKNSRFDEGADVPLPGVRVILANGRQTITDARGRYAFRDVAVGVWQVLFDPAGVAGTPVDQPASLDERHFRHRVSINEITVLDLPITPPTGFAHAYRTTTVIYGPVVIKKEMIPVTEGVYRVVLKVSAEAKVSGLIIEDPLPHGGIKRFDIPELEGETIRIYDIEGEAWLTDPVIEWRLK